MDPSDLARALARFAPRRPGGDAERRAALWLASELRARGRAAQLETTWVRPQWALAYSIYAALGVAASLLSVSQPIPGLALGAVALVSCALDVSGRAQPLRRLTARRATQNVVSPPAASGAPVTLIVCAPYDAPPQAGRTTVTVTRLNARLRAALGGRWPSARAVLVLVLALIVAAAAARVGGFHPSWLKGVQLAPTVALLIALALLLDIALSEPRRDAAAASAAALALALVERLDRDKPPHLDVELVLAGASSFEALGMRAYVRSRRRALRPEQVAVLELRGGAGGAPRFWTSDGALASVRLHPRLIELAQRIAGGERQLGAAPRRGHASSAAHAARLARWPAIAVGPAEQDGDEPDPRALSAVLDFAHALVASLDADLARRE